MQNNQESLKVAVIGYGYSAKTFHIPLIEASPSLVLSSICSSKKEAVKNKFPNIPVFETPKDLLVDGNHDLVVITTPNDLHYPLAKLCLENGKHVVLEKPMVATSLEAKSLISLAKERGLILSVFHNRRWDGDFLTVKKLLKNNLIGDIRFFESHFDRFRPVVQNRWREQSRPASGIWFDLGSHLVDQAVNIFGLPEALTARCLPLRDGSKTTDYFHVLLHYKSLEVVLHGSCFSAAPNNRFRIEGVKGTYMKYGLDPQEEQLKKGLTPIDPLFGEEAEDQFGIFYSELSSEVISTERGCYNKYYEEIAEAINSGIGNPVNPEEIISVIKILELAEESSLSGKRLTMPGY